MFQYPLSEYFSEYFCRQGLSSGQADMRQCCSRSFSECLKTVLSQSQGSHHAMDDVDCSPVPLQCAYSAADWRKEMFSGIHKDLWGLATQKAPMVQTSSKPRNPKLEQGLVPWLGQRNSRQQWDWQEEMQPLTYALPLNLEAHLHKEMLVSWHSTPLEARGLRTSDKMETCAPDLQIRSNAGRCTWIYETKECLHEFWWSFEHNLWKKP